MAATPTESSAPSNGAPSRGNRDAVLADLLRMGDNVELPKAHTDADVDVDIARGRKVDDHGRAVGGDQDDEDEDVDQDEDEDVDQDEDEDLDDDSDEDDDDEDDSGEDLDEEDDDEEEGEKKPARDEDEDLDEDEDKPKPDEKKGDRPKEDPELERRRRSLQQQERRHRETVTRDRAALERDATDARRRIETEWAPRVAKAEKFEKLIERVRFDAPAVLVELGLQPDDFEPIARMLYAMSPAGAAKPENREAAARLQREREAHTETSTLKKEMDELKKTIADRDAQDARGRALEEWRGELADTAKEAEAPLVRRVLEKRPAKAHQEMEAIAYRLMQKDGGRPPSAKRVILAYEKQRRRDLEDAGVDVAAIVKSDGKKKDAASTTTTTTKKDKEKPNDKREVAPTKKGKPKTREEMRDELEVELQEQDRREREAARQ